MTSLPTNRRQLPSPAARERGWTAKGHRAPPEPTGPPLARFSFQRGRNFAHELRTRRHPSPGPARSAPQTPGALGSLPTPLPALFSRRRIRARGPRTVARDWGSFPYFGGWGEGGGARQGCGAAPHPPGRLVRLLPGLARPCQLSGNRLRGARVQRTQQRYAPM